jgi:hypothetical protein
MARPADLPAIADYLGARLGERHGAAGFRRLFEYPWLAEKPDLGALLDDGGRIGGFAGAIYSRRLVGGREHLFCNMTSLCVDERLRKWSLPLVERLLAQPDCTFTVLSPKDLVVKFLTRLYGFQAIDTEKVILGPHCRWPGLLRRPRVEVAWGDVIRPRLTEPERRIFDDHRSYRCGQFLVERGGERCYFVTVRRGRRVRAFADVLYASRPDLLAECIAHVHVPLARTHATLLTGVDARWLPRRPAGAVSYRGLRPVLFRSDVVTPREVDALYTELVPIYG